MNTMTSFRYITVLLLGAALMLISSAAMAQPPRSGSEDLEKIRQLRIAHLTMELDMTDEQAQDFWPVYNKYDKLLSESRRSRPQLKNIDKISDVEAAQILDQMYKSEKAQNEYKEAMHIELAQILGPKQLLKFYRAEHSFKKKLMERLKEGEPRRGQR